MAFVGVFFLTFFLIHFLPGDAFLNEQSLPEASYNELRHHWQLDEPLSVQLSHYLGLIVQGDFGRSMVYPDWTISEIILNSLPISAFLGFCALCVAVLLGIGTALLATLWRHDLYLVITTCIVSMPVFLVGALFQYLFAIEWEWFPVARWGSWQQMVLPVMTLAIAPGAFMGRLLYVRLRAELKEPYARFVESKGLSDYAILFRHAFRNACSPVIAYLGPLTAQIATGSFVVEKIFAIPGLGQWFVLSVMSRDYPLIIAIALLYSLILMTCVLLSDLAALWINPRYRHALFRGVPT